MLTYKTEGSRVYAKGGGSYNCINKITAIELCNKLNELERCKTEYQEIEKTLDRVTRKVIPIQKNIEVLTVEMHGLKKSTKLKRKNLIGESKYEN